ncbi:MAG: SNF2 helicase associated domain-containing protein, partial [Ruthenibacterium sp.]
LEAFWHLYEGSFVSTGAGGKTENYAVTVENPRLRLHVDLQKNGSYTLRFPAHIRVLEGSTCLYLVLNQTIYQCDAAYSRATHKLFDALSKAAGHKLTVAQKDMPALSATLLPTLAPYLSVESDSDLAAFAP